MGSRSGDLSPRLGGTSEITGHEPVLQRNGLIARITAAVEGASVLRFAAGRVVAYLVGLERFYTQMAILSRTDSEARIIDDRCCAIGQVVTAPTESVMEYGRTLALYMAQVGDLDLGEWDRRMRARYGHSLPDLADDR